MPVVPTGAGLAPPEEGALCLEEVAPPASGTRKARVLYDYEAADSSELALLADEVGLGPEGAGKSWKGIPDRKPEMLGLQGATLGLLCSEHPDLWLLAHCVDLLSYYKNVSGCAGRGGRELSAQWRPA